MASNSKGLNILCIDGVGLSGISPMLILSDIMERLGAFEPFGLPKNPYEYFDVIAGTGTGAVLACLLGRLHQPPMSAYAFYGFLTAGLNDVQTFGTSSDPNAYSGAKLKEALKFLAQQATQNQNEPMLDEQLGADACKTMLFATSQQDMNNGTPTIFRSYNSRTNPSPEVTIWEALYRSMAYPDLFPSLERSDDPMRPSTLKSWGGNPIAHVLAEVRNIYPDRHVSCILSIGAGHARTIKVLDPSPETHWLLRTEALAGMKRMATENEAMAQEIAARYPDILGAYYRFNVDVGLRVLSEWDWDDSSAAEDHTNAYKEKPEVTKMIEQTVRAIKDRKPLVRVTSFGGQAQYSAPATISYAPPSMPQYPPPPVAQYRPPPGAPHSSPPAVPYSPPPAVPYSPPPAVPYSPPPAAAYPPPPTAPSRAGTMTNNEDKKGLNILVIDGVGNCGISPMLILSAVMERLGAFEQFGLAKNPCEYFDVIAGTGTGAVHACLLGRLKQPPIMASTFYGFLVNGLSTIQTFGTSNDPSAYSGAKLKEAVKFLAQQATQNQNEPMLDEQLGADACKTMLFATSQLDMNMGTPTIFRSYKSKSNPNSECTIWEALYRSMAYPDVFPSLEHSDDPMRPSTLKSWGGNPIAHVLAEVRSLYPDRHVSSILSIGAGHATTIRVRDPTPEGCHWLLRTEALAAMKKMAAENEAMAEEIAARYPDILGIYYRFNVNVGVRIPNEWDWDDSGAVEKHTKAYLEKAEVTKMIEQTVRAIKDKKAAVKVTSLGGQAQYPAAPAPYPPAPMSQYPPPPVALYRPPVAAPYSPPPTGQYPPPPTAQYSGTPMRTIKPCPTPTTMFTGRDVDISQVETCILGATGERRVCVIHGMGGAGKTQLALKIVERNRNRWAHVIYIDASSKDGIESTLQEVAIIKKLGETYKDAINWLGSSNEPWLVVFDNADRLSLNIQSYFPGGNYGSIIITTRLPDLTMHARGPYSVCHVSSMGHEESLSLLLKVARAQGREISGSEMDAARMLLQDFAHLALAIVHAGTYIGRSPQISLSRYRELFLLQRQRMMEEFQRLQIKVDDYSKAIFATGKMCYELLEPNGDSQRTFWLIAFLHHGAIPEELFQRAATNLRTYRPELPQTQVETSARDYMREYLGRFLGPDGYWDAPRFSRAISELVSCSLLDFDRANLAYSVHPLIQEWSRTATTQPADLALECATTLLSQSIDSGDKIDSHYYRRGLVLHVNKIILQQRGSTSANHASSFAEVYGAAGRWSQKEALDKQVKQASEQALGSDHPHTLASTNNLVSTYVNQGRWDEAVSLQTPVINSQRRMLGYEHPVTLKGTSNLASAYSHQGRWGEAEQLQAQVLNAYKRVYGEGHPETLNCMKDLATTFMRVGRWSDAEVLLVQATGSWNQRTGGQHPDALRAQRYLDAARSRRLIVEDAPGPRSPPPPPRRSVDSQPNVNYSNRPMSFPQPVHSPSTGFGSHIPYA